MNSLVFSIWSDIFSIFESIAVRNDEILICSAKIGRKIVMDFIIFRFNPPLPPSPVDNLLISWYLLSKLKYKNSGTYELLGYIEATD